MHQAVSIYELNLSNSLPCLFFKSAIKSDGIEVMRKKVMSYLPSSNNNELWCFSCNCLKVVCLHDCCPLHCDLCLRIKAVVMKSSS